MSLPTGVSLQAGERGLPRWLSGKECTCNAGNAGDTARPLGQEEPLEEETAAHSRIPAGEIPQTEKPGGLQSMGSQESDMTEHEHEERHVSLVRQTGFDFHLLTRL